MKIFHPLLVSSIEMLPFLEPCVNPLCLVDRVIEEVHLDVHDMHTKELMCSEISRHVATGADVYILGTISYERYLRCEPADDGVGDEGAGDEGVAR